METTYYSRKEKALLSFAGILLIISLIPQWIAGFAGDKDWLLLAANLMLHGKRLYTDIIEVNPPLILWIDIIPAYLSQKFSFIPDYDMLVSLGLLVISAVIALCVQLIAYHPEFTPEKKKRVWFAVLLSFVFITTTSPVYFFDREHIFLVLTFPYVLRLCPTLARARLPLMLRVLIGVTAAIGFCIKPHCAVVFAGLQLITICRERSLRILASLENCIIYGGAVTYAGLVYYFLPEYFSIVLPMAFQTYAGYNLRRNGLFYISCAFLSVATTFVDFRLRYRSPFRADIFYFLGVSVLLLLYALINNGWGYTYNPLLSVLLIITGWVVWDSLYLKAQAERNGAEANDKDIKRFQFCLRNCMINYFCIIVILVTGVYLTLDFDCADYEGCKFRHKLSDMMRQHEFKSFGYMGINFGIIPDIHTGSGAALETRFNHLWMLPKLLTSDEHFIRRTQWIKDYMVNSLAEDMRINKPDAMVVDNSPCFFGTHQHIDLPAYFSTYPAFKKEWQAYRYAGTVDKCNLTPEEEKAQLAHPTKIDCRYVIYSRLK